MHIQLGYVALALGLEKVTSSSTVTYRYYKGLTSEQKINKLKQVTASNIRDLETILQYNDAHHIHFYRLTSSLVPLATHDEVIGWPYRRLFKADFEYMGRLIKDLGLRVDVHADQFNVINSTNPKVVENTIRNLLYLAYMLDDMLYSEGKIIIHVGSTQGGKQASLERFVTHFEYFPKAITDKIIIENDDKSFDMLDVLGLCHRLKVPMVLDVHHQHCHNRGENLHDYIETIFNTWQGDPFIPKIHYSSPKNTPMDRRHSDFIDAKAFVAFIEKTKAYTTHDYDIMLEAKKKDLALFQLVEDIKTMDLSWGFLDETTITL
ncbi:UV DNA damage repair endonuclease UvsE [Vallitalea pronyensis]|uniref:UV DNA damage repair endonuclease UvsE n=1 Tax=Vallitalea pronyensis TaxID=1348613 RepID=A0A8J8SF09_9FIRM|nr:UV DNA damage repair endonuclease UvsE [Vallitalea pronyensis]QUI21115.1 UV DNA damage repair endonuclease UvsE [Vallitalea pronyensis]